MEEETTYVDLLSGDFVLSDEFPHKEILNGMIWEVQGKWVVKKTHHSKCTCMCDGFDFDVYNTIGCAEDEKWIDIVDQFALEERYNFRNQVIKLINVYCIRLADMLESQKKEFLTGAVGVSHYLLSKLYHLQCFSGSTMKGGLIFAYYKDGATDPTFLYFAHGLVKSSEWYSRPRSIQLLPPSLLFESPYPSLFLGSQTKLVYRDLLTGDYILSNLFAYEEILDGMLWEVEGECRLERRKLDGNGGLDDQSDRLINIVDAFSLKELPAFSGKQFLAFMQVYSIRVEHMLESKKKKEFLKGIKGATKFLFSKVKELKFFTGRSFMGSGIRGSLIFAYNKDGASNTTYLYFAHGLKSV